MNADTPISHSSGRALGVPMRMQADERLARAVTAGNEHAFTALFKRYHQQLYRYSRSLTGNDQDAQDALQSALIKALVALREGRRNAPVRPWLFRIVHNESISLLRSRGNAQDLPTDLEASHAVLDSVEQRERLTLLIADLRELPERQRGALVMRELSGLSHEEIAQALQVSVGAAKQVILEARRSLLEFAEGRAMTCDAIQRVLSDADRRSLRSRRVRAHLRDCASCAAFAAAIPRRRADLLALSPALPAAGAAGLLAKLTGAGSGHGGGSGAGLVAGTAAKGVGVTVSAKVAAAAGAAVVATATVGAVAVLPRSATSRPASVSHTLPRAHHPADLSSANAGGGTGVAVSHHGARGNGLAGQVTDHGRGHGSYGRSASPAHGRGHAHSTTHGNSASHGNSAAHGNSASHGNSSAHGNSPAHGNPATHGNSAAHGNSTTHGNSTAQGNSAAHRNSATHGNSAAHGNSTTHGNSAAHRNSAAHGNPAGHPATRGKSATARGHSVTRSQVTSQGLPQSTHGKATESARSTPAHSKTGTTHTPRKTRRVTSNSKPKTRSKARGGSKAKTTAKGHGSTTAVTTTVAASTVTTVASASGTNNGHGNGATPPGQGGSSPANKAANTP